MARRRLKVDFDKLTDAWQNNSRFSHHVCYLNLETGTTVRAPEESDYDSDKRWIPIPEQDSRESYRDMADFIETVENNRIRGLLRDAINGSGAFRNFREILNNHLDEQDRWNEFRYNRNKQRVLLWLDALEIDPISRW